MLALGPIRCNDHCVPALFAGDQASGDAVCIREANSEDAGALLALKHALDHETAFMLLEPGERTTTETEVAEELERAAARPNSVVLVAEAASKLVAYVEASGGRVRRNRHTAHVVIGVQQAFAGQGIGGRLLGELDLWGQANGLRRLELTVMTHNDRAIGLYTTMGYRVEGTREAALLVGNQLVDELWMARLL